MNMIQLIFSFVLGSSAGQALQYEEPQKLSTAEMGAVTTAFKNSWHALEIDEIGYGKNSYQAKKFLEPLPIFGLGTACNGEQLYYLDLIDFKLIDNGGKPFDYGLGYTGSGGTRRLILALDKTGTKFRKVYDGHIIEMLGALKPGEECAPIGIVLSGNYFKDSKSNSEYRDAKITYKPSSRNYEWLELRSEVLSRVQKKFKN